MHVANGRHRSRETTRAQICRSVDWVTKVRCRKVAYIKVLCGKVQDAMEQGARCHAARECYAARESYMTHVQQPPRKCHSREAICVGICCLHSALMLHIWFRHVRPLYLETHKCESSSQLSIGRNSLRPICCHAPPTVGNQGSSSLQLAPAD